MKTEIAPVIGIGNNYRFVVMDDEAIADLLMQNMKGAVWFPESAREFHLSLKGRSSAISHEDMRKIIANPSDLWNGIIAKAITKAANEKLFPDRMKIQEAHNIVPSAFRNELALLISGTTITPTLKANYLALGTGSTAVSNSDTQLATEATRGLFSNRSAADNVAYLDRFFATATVAGNSYNEVGIFIDGTGSANTGTLLSRLLVSLTLGANQTLTVNASITIS